MSRQRAIMNWSGGKDSALALYHSLRSGEWAIEGLLTSVNERYGRVSMHGVWVGLLKLQAERLGLPLHTLQLPETVSMDEYNTRMYDVLQPLHRQGVTHALFGDIFLEDLRSYREGQLAKANLTGAFPLWKRKSTDLVREFVELGFRAVLVCINETYLPAEFLGRELDMDLLNDLPKQVDPCGENGEYHSFVYDGPIFSEPISFQKGEVVRRTYLPSATADRAWDNEFWYLDLLLV